MVAPEHRGTDLIVDFSNNMPVPIPIEQISVTFGVCEPHLLSFYASLGQIPYADRNIGSDDAGYLVPIISFPGGVPTCVQHLVEGHCAVTSPILVGDDAYWREVSTLLPVLVKRGLFEGLATHEIRTCVERSNLIDCQPGDRVVKRDSSSHNVYVVLSGALEARDGDEVRGRIMPGDSFGETAFVLECNRTLDVYVTAPGTRILSLSDRTLRRATADTSQLAPRLLRNLSKTLCRRSIAGEA
jgi:hypothetical protein